MAKRAFDITVAGLGLLLLSPLFLLIVLLVKFGSPGPVFHRGPRIGRNGQPFFIFKFRSMVINAAALGPAVTTGDDPRITRIGRILRKTKMDELPQLLNVLRGEMSLVGPRPEDPRYVAMYTPEQRRVLSVRPGITSLASVEYRNEESMLSQSNLEEVYTQVVMPRKLEIDLAYVDRMSLWSDVQVLAKTAAALFRTETPAEEAQEPTAAERR